MPSDIKKDGPVVRIEPDLSQRPDTGLSAAIRHVLGGKGVEPHVPGLPLKPGQEIAKRARLDKAPSPGKGAPRKTHIGPRSGHK